MATKLCFVKWTAIAVGRGNHLRRLPVVVGLVATVGFILMCAWPTGAQFTGTTEAPLPSFEVTSVKRSRPGEDTAFHARPNRLVVRNMPTQHLIEIAYGHDWGEFGFTELGHDEVVGGPSWIRPGEFDYEGYDIEGKVEDSVAEKFGKDCGERAFAHSACGYRSQMMLMFQSLLADRFKLRVRHETREGPIYALVIAKGGPKFLHTTFPVPDTTATGPGPAPRPPCPPGMVCAQRYLPMGQMADWLTSGVRVGRPVIDQTGLQGGYYIKIQWAREQPQGSDTATGMAPPLLPSGPSIFAALQQQLGLKLEPTKGPVQVLVIDHIEKPSEN